MVRLESAEGGGGREGERKRGREGGRRGARHVDRGRGREREAGRESAPPVADIVRHKLTHSTECELEPDRVKAVRSGQTCFCF